MNNKTERYMIIFNDVGLTIKGYYQELISPLERKKILDRLYSLIHQELFEGVQPLEQQAPVTALQNEPIDRTLPVEPKVKREYKHKKSYYKKHKKPLPEAVSEPAPDISNQSPNPEPISTFKLEVPNEPKDPLVSAYDNEKDDNQYNEFKKKGLI